MRHEDIQKIYKNHYFLSRRDMGGVRTLTGSVDVVVFFVSDTETTWTDYAKNRYKAAQKAAMQYILRTARERGVSLQIRNAYVDVTVPMNCTPDNYRTWSQKIISKYGAQDIPAYQRKHENVKNCTEVPILFVLNKPFRSSAVSVDWESRWAGELALISSQYTEHTIIHELLHQFGAMDLYYPREVSDLVQSMNYKSVMASCDTKHIDPLSSYLIGWTDEIDSYTVLLLERTKHFTREYMFEATRREYENS